MAKRLFIVLILFTVGIFRCYAQFDNDFCNDINDKKLIKSFQKGVQLLNDGKMDEAETIFAKIIDEEPEFTEAWVASSEINYSKYKSAKDPKSQNNYYSRYVKCLESVAKNCPSYQNYEVCYTLGKIFFSHDKFDAAKKYLKTYIDNGKKGTKYYTDAESTYHYIEQYLNLIENPVPFEPVVD